MSYVGFAIEFVFTILVCAWKVTVLLKPGL